LIDVNPEVEDQATDVPAFLCCVDDGFEVEIVVSLLKSYNIPVMRKSREAGGYLKIFTGRSFFGVDIYVPSKLLEKAREVISAKPIVEEESDF
jgi:hypothetical protein